MVAHAHLRTCVMGRVLSRKGVGLRLSWQGEGFTLEREVFTLVKVVRVRGGNSRRNDPLLRLRRKRAPLSGRCAGGTAAKGVARLKEGAPPVTLLAPEDKK